MDKRRSEIIFMEDFEENPSLSANSKIVNSRDNHEENQPLPKGQVEAYERDEEVFVDLHTDKKPDLMPRMWPKQRQCLDINVKGLYYFGFWPAEGPERRDMLFYWRYIFPRVELVRMMYSILFQAINMSLVWGNPSQMVEYGAMLGSYAMVLSKCTAIFLNQATMRDMASTLERLCSQSSTTNKHIKVSMEKTNRKVDFLTKFFVVITAIISVLIALGLIIQGFIKGTIPFRRWFPYDAYSSPAYEVTMICTFFTVPFDTHIVALCSTMFVAMAMHILEQFQALSQKLKHVRANVTTAQKDEDNVALLSECPFLPATNENSKQDARAMPEQSVKGNQSEALSDENATKARKEIGRVVTRGNVRNQKRSLGVGGARPRRSEARMETPMIVSERRTLQQMELFIKLCIQDHQALIQLCAQLGSVFKFMLFFQVACNIFCGILVLYITALADSVDLKFLSIAAISFLCYIEYLFFCWYGNRITEESENVREALYDCDWFGASDSFKRSMRIVMLRTYKPIIIRAGGLPLSMPTFKKIYKAAYYLNMIMSKLFHGEKLIQ